MIQCHKPVDKMKYKKNERENRYTCTSRPKEEEKEMEGRNHFLKFGLKFSVTEGASSYKD